MAIVGVILDVDGTLVSSNDAHAQAWVEAFSHYGYEIPFEQVRPLIGMGGDQIIPRLVPALNNQEGVGKQVADRRKELVLNKFGHGLAPTNGAHDLVKKMRDDGFHLIIASSATEQEMELLLKVAQVDGLVSEFTNSSDVETSKPEPDLVEAALSKANLQPDSTVMLGDTPYDIEAARKAGVNVIAFRTGGFSDQQLQGAIAIYDDPSDLLRHYETSPLAINGSRASTVNSELMMPDTFTPDTFTPDSSTPDTSATEMAADTWQLFQAKTTTFFAKAPASLSAFFKNNQPLLTNLGWFLLALVGLKLLLTVLDVVDNIPLISPVLKLVGLLYMGWFVWRYLLRASNRQELLQMLDRFKAELLGDQG